jgi:hypothetical protein
LAANKFGWLAQGVGNLIKSTNTIKLIHKHEVPRVFIQRCNVWPIRLHWTTWKVREKSHPLHNRQG